MEHGAEDRQDIHVGDGLTTLRVTRGSAVRALNGKGAIGGHLVLFGSPETVDLFGTYFDAQTDFDLVPGLRTAVYYHHGFDDHFGRRVLARGALGMDDVGVWIEAQLDLHDEWLAALYELIEAGVMGWSSGTAAHLVEMEPRGDVQRVRRWPLGLDASITPAPADPRQIRDIPPFRALVAARGSRGRAEERSRSVMEELEKKDVREVQTTSEVRVVQDGLPQENDTRAELHALNARVDAFTRQMHELMDYVRSAPELRRARYVTDDGGTADAGVRSFGDFCLAVMRGDAKRLRSVYHSRPFNEVAVRADMVESSGDLGGWAVPEDFDARLLQIATRASSFLGRVPRVTVSLPAGRWPVWDIFNAPAAGSGDTAEAAGVTGTARAEGGAYVETNPQLEQIEWRVTDAVAGSIQVSKELRRDVAQLEGMLMRLIAINDQSKQEYFVLRGTGVGQPLGILNSGAAIGIVPAVNNVFSWVDALTMYSRLYVIDESTVYWIIHPSIVPDIGTLEVGTAGGAVFMANLSANIPVPLLGYPAVKSQHLPQANSSGAVVLVDWSAYQIWDLGGAYLDFSEHVGFLQGLDTWRFGRYMDGKPLWRAPLTLADPQGGFTQSPIVYHND